MADQSYGLRFDIYERVHLSEDVIGIEELEEIELFPKIQVIPGQDYASLRGHLLLAGLYRGRRDPQPGALDPRRNYDSAQPGEPVGGYHGGN